MKAKSITPAKRAVLNRRRLSLKISLAQDTVFKKIERERKRRQKRYIKEIMKLGMGSIPGLMTYDVPPKTRAWFLANKRVTFAIAKYGREGLDCSDLDTIIVSTPFSKRNAMQQLMGRILRILKGKQRPVLVINEDAVGMCIGMCMKLRKALADWPEDAGGPYTYGYIANPLGGAHQCQIETALGP